MKESKLQKLIDECSEIEQGNYLSGKMGADLKECQSELQSLLYSKRKCLIDFAYAVNIHDGNIKKIQGLVDLYLNNL